MSAAIFARIRNTVAVPGAKISAPNLVGHAGSECVSVMDILTHQMAKMSQQQGVDRCFSESGALHFLRPCANVIETAAYA
jgi:hypothetical protein